MKLTTFWYSVTLGCFSHHEFMSSTENQKIGGGGRFSSPWATGLKNVAFIKTLVYAFYIHMFIDVAQQGLHNIFSMAKKRNLLSRNSS